MSTSLLTVKGQTTIPKKIREYLHLQAGDRLTFIIQRNGKVVLKPASVDVKELQGIMPKPKKSATLEDMGKAIRKRAVKKYME